ncbi:MAG: transposase [Chloroflexi bacterium]|nr:transposase [Chloroflexota bacterium]
MPSAWFSGLKPLSNLENVWRLFKRSVMGCYHKLSTKHLNAYLDELGLPFNNHKNPYLFSDTLMKLLTAETLPYQRLTIP